MKTPKPQRAVWRIDVRDNEDGTVTIFWNGVESETMLKEEWYSDEDQLAP